VAGINLTPIGMRIVRATGGAAPVRARAASSHPGVSRTTERRQGGPSSPHLI